jgi:tetratricopeptide (TPR) repeat protein
MKRFTFLLLMLAAVTAYAQKPVKPNLNKALASLNDGKLDEAKANIDAAITHEKMMNEGKTWYYRGLIYAAIDTTSNETFKALAPDAFATALEAFKKADTMADPKKEYMTQAVGGLPVPKSQQMLIWANKYLNLGANLYQEEDFENAITNFEKVQQIVPEDTTAYFYGGFAANQAENWDKAISNFTNYIQKGGKSSDAYSLMININSGIKEDKEKALTLVREARQKFPANPDFPKVEIGLLIDLKRIDEAKSGLEAQIQREPDNKILHFYLGYANASLNQIDVAKKNYEDALRLDPQYFEAQLYLAKLVYTDAATIKKEMSNLGISEADKKKRFALDKTLVEKLKVALPYWEKAEKMKPDDQEVLDVLYSIYTDLDMQDQIKRIDKRFKELGLDN